MSGNSAWPNVTRRVCGSVDLICQVRMPVPRDNQSLPCSVFSNSFISSFVELNRKCPQSKIASSVAPEGNAWILSNVGPLFSGCTVAAAMIAVGMPLGSVFAIVFRVGGGREGDCGLACCCSVVCFTAFVGAAAGAGLSGVAVACAFVDGACRELTFVVVCRGCRFWTFCFLYCTRACRTCRCIS